jgi:hypothetical protein
MWPILNRLIQTPAPTVYPDGVVQGTGGHDAASRTYPGSDVEEYDSISDETGATALPPNSRRSR